MPYCVKCGVELDKSAKKCALCDTPVYMPNIKEDSAENAPFSDVAVVPVGIKKKFIALIISIVMAIPSVTCFVVNLFYNKNGYWSVYVISSAILLWIIAVLPFYLKKIKPYLLWAFDTVAVSLYVYIFFPMMKENTKYYLTVALPLIATVSACVFVFILWSRGKERHWSSVLIHCIIDICVISTSVCLVCSYYNAVNGVIASLIVFLSSLFLLAFGIYCNCSKRMRAWLKKKLFV